MDFLDALYKTLIVDDRWIYYFEGLGVTIQISALSIFFGTILGIFTAFMKLSNYKIVRVPAVIYINVIRGTPLVTQLLLIYFGIFATVRIDKITVAVIAFSINSGAYIAEIIRAGINAVDGGQMEAGRSLGLTKWQTMLRIILPQAIKKILPTYTNEFIVLIKETAVVGYIAIEDLTKVGDIIRGSTFDGMTPMIVSAVFYLCLTLILTKIFGLIERRFAKSDRN